MTRHGLANEKKKISGRNIPLHIGLPLMEKLALKRKISINCSIEVKQIVVWYEV